MTVSSNKAYA